MISAQFLPWLFAHASPTPTPSPSLSPSFSPSPSPSATAGSPQVIAAIIAASVAFLTLIGTLLTAYFSRRATKGDLEEQRKQLDKTLAEQRYQTLNERFAAAAEQLGGDKPPAVRLAGVYAMAGLADDWEDKRQTCIDVLCGYLRIPDTPDASPNAPRPELALRGGSEVRHTVIRIITEHLQIDKVEAKAAGKDVVAKAKSWADLNFDFTGAVFDGGDFSDAWFLGSVSFSGAQFSGGTVSFRSAAFTDEATVDFSGAVFSGGTVDFSGAQFVHGGTVRFSGAAFTDGATVSFSRATFGDGEVNFSEAVFSGGTVDFGGAEFSGGTVDFSGAEFSGGDVSFVTAIFAGGTVDFSTPGDWSTPPAFPWTDTLPPGVKLP